MSTSSDIEETDTDESISGNDTGDSETGESSDSETGESGDSETDRWIEALIGKGRVRAPKKKPPIISPAA